MTETRTPDLGETLRRILDNREIDIHVALPGVLKDYDTGTKSATIRLEIRREHAIQGMIEFADLPNVRVALPSGGGYGLSLPLSSGDPGLVVFSERSLDEWSVRGGAVDPSAENHGLNGAVFYPGISPNDSAPANLHASDAVFGKEDGSFEIRVTSSKVLLGDSTASAAVARVGDSVSTTLNAADIAAIAVQLVAGLLVLPGVGGGPVVGVLITGSNTISSGSPKVDSA